MVACLRFWNCVWLIVGWSGLVGFRDDQRPEGAGRFGPCYGASSGG